MFLGVVVAVSGHPASASPPHHYHIATYNSLGARWGDVSVLSRRNDIVAVQEAGPAPDFMTYVDHEVSNGYAVWHYTWDLGRYGERHVYWMQTDPNGNRVNLATVTRGRAHSVHVVPGAAGGRAALGLRYDNDIYYDIHARATGTANEALQLLRRIDGQAPQGYWWTALGDFNRDPDSVRTTARALNAHIYHTGRATQRAGGELDYMVSSRAIENYTAFLNNGMASDHFPVEFREVPVQAAGGIRLVSDGNDGRAIDVKESSRQNGAQIITYDFTGNLNEVWRARPAAGNNWNLVSNLTNKCIDVELGADAKVGSRLNQWDCQGQRSQEFRFWSWGDDYGSHVLIHPATNLCVDITGRGNGTRLALNRCDISDAGEKFIVDPSV